jgi:uncharacterized protein
MSAAEERLRARLTDDLRAAMKTRDGPRVSVLRSLIAALDNASAIPIDDPQAAALKLSPESSGRQLEGQSREVPRRVLSQDDLLQVFAVEMAERRNAALALEKHGCYEEATVVRGELEIIEGYASGAVSSAAGSG